MRARSAASRGRSSPESGQSHEIRAMTASVTSRSSAELSSGAAGATAIWGDGATSTVYESGSRDGSSGSKGLAIATVLPPVAAPVESVMPPLLPLDVVPEENESAPLTPLVPALAVFIEMAPLVVAVPFAEAIVTAPPV